MKTHDMVTLTGDIVQRLCNATMEYALVISYPRRRWAVYQQIHGKYRQIVIRGELIFNDYNKSLTATASKCLRLAPMKYSNNVVGVFDPNSIFVSQGLPVVNTASFLYTVPPELLPIPFEGNIIPTVSGQEINGGQIRFSATTNLFGSQPQWIYAYITVDNPQNPTAITTFEIIIAGQYGSTVNTLRADPTKPITLL